MSDETTKTLEGPNGLSIELNRAEVFLNDPGNGTPAMVRLQEDGETYSATYTCAYHEGMLAADGMRPIEIALTPRQLRWLREQQDEVDEFLYSR